MFAEAPIVAHVLSPLKYVVAEGVPVADNDADTMPDVVIGPPDKVSAGSSSVIVSGKPAARMGDSSGHGGKIVAGCPTVLIG